MQPAAARGLERKGFDEAMDAVLDRYVEPIEPGEVMAYGEGATEAG